MPTYRGRAMGDEAMTNIVKELYDNEQLDLALSSGNYVFVVKLHPLTPHIQLKNRNNFLILDYNAVSNNQELLAVSDMLITDYSSCFVDFALMGKPIHFYCPDEKQFLEVSEKMNDDFFCISGLSKSKTSGELIEFLLNPTTIVCDATNEIFEDDRIKGTCYSENVCQVISEKIDYE